MKIQRKSKSSSALWQAVSIETAISDLEGGGYWPEGTAKSLLKGGKTIWSQLYSYRKKPSELNGLEDISAKARTLIDTALLQCDPALTPHLCSTLHLSGGKEKLRDLILDLMAREGLSAQAAIAHIEAERL